MVFDVVSSPPTNSSIHKNFKLIKDILPTFTVNNQVFEDVIVVKEVDQIFHYHHQSGPSSIYTSYYARDIGLIRKDFKNEISGQNYSVKFSDYYIAPH